MVQSCCLVHSAPRPPASFSSTPLPLLFHSVSLTLLACFCFLACETTPAFIVARIALLVLHTPRHIRQLFVPLAAPNIHPLACISLQTGLLHIHRSSHTTMASCNLRGVLRDSIQLHMTIFKSVVCSASTLLQPHPSEFHVSNVPHSQTAIRILS
jgi:hypothetical protein